VLGLPRAPLRVPQGFGFLSPPGEGLDIIGATVSSNAFEEQAPPGKILIMAFAGGVFAPGMVDLPSDEAVTVVDRNLRRAFGARGGPEFVRDVVWRRAIPQYQRHHVATVRRIERLAGEVGGLHLAGNSYRGVGLEDTIRDAERLGRVLIDTELGRVTAREAVAPAGPTAAPAGERGPVEGQEER
jgi:oxygen-dependent protoporphyrinogen oxidase